MPTSVGKCKWCNAWQLFGVMGTGVMVSMPIQLPHPDLHNGGAADEEQKTIPSWNRAFLELNFEKVVTDTLQFFTSARGGFTKPYITVLQRDHGLNSLGHNSMSDRDKEVQVCGGRLPDLPCCHSRYFVMPSLWCGMHA
jgi:hypothetical protein